MSYDTLFLQADYHGRAMDEQLIDWTAIGEEPLH